MRFARSEKRDPGTPLAPLLDVVLLLLIFFVVTSSFAERQLPVELPGAEAGARAEAAQLVVNVDAAGRTVVDGEPVEREVLAERFAAAVAEARSVELRADRRARHGAVVEVLDAASRAGLESIGIAVGPGASAAPPAADGSGEAPAQPAR